jgi:hypothetical protein
MADLIEEDFKTAVLKMSKELKEDTEKGKENEVGTKCLHLLKDRKKSKQTK